jgi:hypothetical protein
MKHKGNIDNISSQRGLADFIFVDPNPPSAPLRAMEFGQKPLLPGLLQNWLTWPGVLFLQVHECLG